MKINLKMCGDSCRNGVDIGFISGYFIFHISGVFVKLRGYPTLFLLQQFNKLKCNILDVFSAGII